MDSNGDAQAAARELARRAQEIRFTAGRRAWRKVLWTLTDGQFGRTGPSKDRRWGPFEREGWRVRAAELDDDHAFAVTYWVCRRCRRGWVEWPYTAPQYVRCGLAGAGLAALRADTRGWSGTPWADTIWMPSRFGSRLALASQEVTKRASRVSTTLSAAAAAVIKAHASRGGMELDSLHSD